MNIEDRCRKIELIFSDVDGVLTDGGVLYDNQGIEIKKFYIRDGLGIRLWQKAGFKFGVLTARTSHIVKLRAAELNIEIVRQGFEDKLPVAKEAITELELSPDQVCFIGDDLTDLPVMQYVGVGIAVADAAAEVRDAADYVTNSPGGRGAVREVAELLLKSKNRWEDLIRGYTG
ncbi:MAG: HAD hydrolase family protein [Planctomycetes bacterium]|nr:HAD hydrolase family protein [Planctomycetota bacterium]